VVQGRVEREDRRLLPAVRGLRRGERRRDLVGELAFLPEPAGLIDELLQLGGDVAEAGRRSERDAIGPLEVVKGSDRLVGDIERWRPQYWFWEMTSSDASSSTWRRRTSAPASSAPSATACASAWTFPLAL